MTNIAGGACALVLCFALAFCVHAVPIGPKLPPVSGPDMFAGVDLEKDELLPGEKIINVKDFEANPDGTTDSTEGFMSAWQAACKSTQQARFFVPQGKWLISPMFFSGPCLMPKPITIQVEGTVLASTDPSEYVNGQWLVFQNMAGVKLRGGGTFDGQGKSLWGSNVNCDKSPSSETCVRLPSSIEFNNITHGVMHNITSLNPKGFHFSITNSANIRILKLKLTAPGDSPNTDGLHFSHSNNIIVSDTNIATGDDCISIIQAVNNVRIEKVKCGPGHGISIGSLGKYKNELEVKNVTVTNCTLDGTNNGVRIKTWPDKFSGHAEDVTYEDIIMNNVKNPVIIDQEYNCRPNACNKKPSLVTIKTVVFRNIKGTTISPFAVDLRCSKDNPCEDVTLENIELKTAAKPTGSRCANIKPIYKGLQDPAACP